MSYSSSGFLLFGGRLAVDFANLPSLPASGQQETLSWEELTGFLQDTKIVSPERAEQLLLLTETEAQSAELLLRRAQQLRNALRLAFEACVRRQKLLREWVEPINEVLRVTEGHDELVGEAGSWRIEYVAREGGLDWLLAAVARSAAEILSERAGNRLRFCANPGCSLLFYDVSRTQRRRWCSMASCGNRNKVAAFARRHSLRKKARSASA
jgi:predicted RNA-binding Zn ribbon-like protein